MGRPAVRGRRQGGGDRRGGRADRAARHRSDAGAPLRIAADADRHPERERALDDAGAALRAWVVGQLLAMVVLAVFTAIGLWVLRVPYWLAFGIFTGLVAIVPFFGTLVSTLLPALFVLGTGNWLQALAVAAWGVAVHFFEANLIAPLIMGEKVALPPVLTIASVLGMGTLLGAIGLVVAVPVVAVSIVLVRHVVQGELYGDLTHVRPAVLRASGEFRGPGTLAKTQTSA